MPKVHFVKKALKAKKSHGIKKGDSYYWWQFYRCGKSFSLTRPKPSQLTRSEYLSTFYATQEGVEDALRTFSGIDKPEDSDFEELADALESAAEELDQLGSDQEEKASNMEGAFPSGCPTIELLNERTSACAETQQELSDAATTIRDLDFESEDAATEAINAVESLSWQSE